MHFITMKTQLLYSGKLHLRCKFFYKQRFLNISLHIIKIWGLPPYHCFIKFLTTAIGIYLRIHILEISIWKTWKFHQLLVMKRCSSINIMRTSKKPSNNFWGNVKLHEKLGLVYIADEFIGFNINKRLVLNQLNLSLQVPFSSKEVIWTTEQFME